MNLFPPLLTSATPPFVPPQIAPPCPRQWWASHYWSATRSFGTWREPTPTTASPPPSDSLFPLVFPPVGPASLAVVGFTLLVNNTFIRDIVEKNSNHCIFSPEPNGALACRPRDLPLYSPLVIFNSRNDFNTRVNLSSVCCLDVMAGEPKG
ncbi:unnamed protein product [Closterium sp. NIES-54]